MTTSLSVISCHLVGGLLLMNAAAGAPPKSQSHPRSVSTWFVYQGEDSIEALRPHADIISSISVCGQCPAAFVAQCHELGIEVFLLKGGGDGAVFATPEGRRELIQHYVNLCTTTGADGVDVNFESLEKEARDDYSRLLRELADALHRADKRLSMCVSYVMSTWRTVDMTPGQVPEIDGGWYDPVVVGEACDLVRVMCYDMHSVSAAGVGPVSTRPWAEDAMRFWMTYVPKENLVMGIPAYSRDYAFGDTMTIHTLYQPAPSPTGGSQATGIWLPYENIHLYKYADDTGIQHIFFASDVHSTRAHLESAAALDLTAAGFWHAAAATEKEWDAIRQWVTDSPSEAQ